MGKVFLAKGGNSGGGSTQTYTLKFDDGTEIPAVETESAVTLTATENDIRKGTYAVTNDGVVEGQKVIPSYYTSEGATLISPGKEFKISGLENYEYTKLQAIICTYNNSTSKSVSAIKVAINSKIYNVKSTSELSTVTVDESTKSIKFGITNDESTTCVIRYFTYREEY
jgi:hypothetical protein